MVYHNAMYVRSIDVRDQDGYTTLMLAVKAGSERFVNFFLNFGAKAMLDDDKGCEAAATAIRKGHAKIVNMLYLAHVRNVDIVEEDMWKLFEQCISIKDGSRYRCHSFYKV